MSAVIGRYPWERLAGETAQEYAQFDAYKSLGSARSIDKAYRFYTETVAGPDEVGNRGKRAPGNWQNLACRMNWKERAVQWDCTQVRLAALRVATVWITSIERLAERGLQGVIKHKPGDKEWPGVLDTFRVLTGYLSEEGVRAIGEAGGPAPSAEDEPTGVPLSCLNPAESHEPVPLGELVYGDGPTDDDGIT